MEDLAGLIAGFVGDERFAIELHDSFVRHVKRATSRYPDAYFELGQKSPEAIEGLADRSFVVCARVAKGRFPFSARTPFQCFVEERFDDPPIRYHSFYAKLSITRELLRDDYAFNLRRNPVLRWKDDLHRSIGAWLKEHAHSEESSGGGHRRWRLSGFGPRLIRSDEVIVDKLRALGTEDLERLIPEALKLAGQPVAHSRLSNWLAEVLPAPADTEHLDESTPAQENREIREAVVKAWNELGSDERELIGALANGESYDSLIARVPRFRDRSSVSRAVKSCGGEFVKAIHKALGIPFQEAESTPKEVIERVTEVLLPLLPEMRQREVS